MCDNNSNVSGNKEEPFWTEDIWVLMNDINFLPTKNMTKNEKLNAITRLLIIATIFLLVLGYSNAFSFLFFAILIILFMKYSMMGAKKIHAKCDCGNDVEVDVPFIETKMPDGEALTKANDVSYLYNAQDANLLFANIRDKSLVYCGALQNEAPCNKPLPHNMR
jgi:hypothetical protein